LGVGTNQNYLMAGWANASHLIIIDFDQVIVHVHDAYRAFFLQAETPDDLLDFWRPRSKYRRAAYQVLKDTYEKRGRRAAARNAVRKFGHRVYLGLKESIKHTQKLGVPSFLTDQAQFEHIKKLYQENRIFVIRGDFTARRTLNGISEMLDELEMPLSVLYLSNVEQYIGWNRAFRRNMERLPVRDDGFVLRTYGWGKHRTADHNYRYYVQSGAAFKEWIGSKKRYVGGFLKSEEKTEIVGYHEMTKGPEGDRFELASAASSGAQGEDGSEGRVDDNAGD
ncbi:MAG: hypothetical protein AAFQ82_12490, partial [Myxococcota bacterium]